MPVSIKGTGGGSVTLDAGAAAADSTLTLPNTSGTILSSGTTITVAQGGTGLTTMTAANNALYSTSSSAVTAGTLPVAAGGTGAATLTANAVLIGNGTSAVTAVAPSTAGNVLTSNGTAWVSSTPASGGVSSIVAGTGITTSGTTTVTVNIATTAGAVGTYAFLASSSGALFTAGSTYAGSGLVYSGLAEYNVTSQTSGCQNFSYTAAHIVTNGGAVSGTWRAMGTVTSFGSGYSATLFIRIA